jgi:hypothetical protein
MKFLKTSLVLSDLYSLFNISLNSFLKVDSTLPLNNTIGHTRAYPGFCCRTMAERTGAISDSVRHDDDSKQSGLTQPRATTRSNDQFCAPTMKKPSKSRVFGL